MTLRNFIYLTIFSILFLSSSCYRLRGQSGLTKALLKARDCQGDSIFNYPGNTDGDWQGSGSNVNQGSDQSGAPENKDNSVPPYSQSPGEEDGDEHGFGEESEESGIFGEAGVLACEIVKVNCRTVRGRQVCDMREIC